MKHTKKLLPVLMTLALSALPAGIAFADTITPLEHTTQGMGSVVDGVVTTVATPAVALVNISQGHVDEALGNSITMPVKGLISATAGTVQMAGGISSGLAQMTGTLFNGLATAAGTVTENVNRTIPGAAAKNTLLNVMN